MHKHVIEAWLVDKPIQFFLFLQYFDALSHVSSLDFQNYPRLQLIYDLQPELLNQLLNNFRTYMTLFFLQNSGIADC